MAKEEGQVEGGSALKSVANLKSNTKRESRAVALGLEWIEANARRFAERIAPVYEALNWKWADEARLVPTARGIEDMIIRLATVKKKRFFFARSGGLEVGVIASNNGEGEEGDFEAYIRFVDQILHPFAAEEADRKKNL
ncbi:hypothetical protein HY493_03445 [Candidatus Woesearchaeota archaeon]|nr:hypothetical protein [Candidatus Woesearchaeota archaeon]